VASDAACADPKLLLEAPHTHARMHSILVGSEHDSWRIRAARPAPLTVQRTSSPRTSSQRLQVQRQQSRRQSHQHEHQQSHQQKSLQPSP